MSKETKEQTLPPFQIAVVPVTPLQQNCSILVCTKTDQAAIVDPGGDVPEIMAALKKLGAKARAIWLTHGHFDHAGGAMELAAKTGAKIHGPHADDKWLLDQVASQCMLYGVDGGRDVTPDVWLEEGDTVRFGEVSFDVLQCPGHTPGHVLFLNREAKIGLFGDVLFKGSIGRTDFDRGDHAALLAGIKEKIFPLPDDFAFIPGHGEFSTVGEEKRSNPFLRGL